MSGEQVMLKYVPLGYVGGEGRRKRDGVEGEMKRTWKGKGGGTGKDWEEKGEGEEETRRRGMVKRMRKREGREIL